ncbi:peptidoglycan editing factor PgeF [Indioceanicola profundi]|uniref:peptidoglycan editing factor PgeF n=1 Tax=Indioceanicola profundi TaxID=2220096 RepID=UPI001968C798|nr:peptidoglycan editing factor PgeF [Indioceanicola profundi]
MITLGVLNDIPGIRHGFFTRQGGVSTGIYASLNCGFGSNDAADAVAENRRRVAEKLGRPAQGLVTVHQIHSPDVAVAETPWVPADAPKADAMVTRAPDVTLGILTADCAPVLFCDPTAKVIGAAHAGWKGAFGGVLEATIAAMKKLGAEPSRIVAAIGPHISRNSYEVGPEFRERLVADAEANASWFVPSQRAEHWMFDLGGYVASRLAAAGIGHVERAPHDTLAEEDLFFSYRRSTLRGEPDYGRFLSAITLAP